MNEMPGMASMNYVSAVMPLNNLLNVQQQNGFLQQAQAVGQLLQGAQCQPQPQPQKKETVMSARRIVQVFIVDPNENVPLENAVLYRGDQKITDLTDQELFFEIDIKSILATYNETRIAVVDKKVKERIEHLEPARIRDLKMVVVNVASF